MASLSFYKRRIASTGSLQKIFRAQELIATSRIRVAKENAEATTPYSNEIETALSLAFRSVEDLEHPLITPTKTNRVGILILTSDRGMAGPFNSGILRQVDMLSKKLLSEQKKLDLYVTGRRGVSYFNFRAVPLKGNWVGQSEHPNYDLAKTIGETLIKDMLPSSNATFSHTNNRLDEIYVVYALFKNMVVQTPSITRLLPLKISNSNSGNTQTSNSQDSNENNSRTTGNYSGVNGSDKTNSIYIFEPSLKEILDELLKRYIYTRINHLLFESAASETASRQRAMHTANDNANDLLELLTRQMNQARQSNITNELNEIVGAANALKQGQDQ
ncbi:MAG: F0F1 ATP synthase subunit gamma [Bifidobacteriaceae bacterium]|jgi:F-type H+-transporting ATPase subunit gamma|nr:F0F1 ATP synthase subunit gamma [Bifidobacteriaceae bacterium]